MSDAQRSIRRVDWRKALEKLGAAVDEADRQVIALLAEGKSTPEIARIVGTNRSAIWRRVSRLRAEVEE